MTDWLRITVECRGCGHRTDVYPRQNALGDPRQYQDMFIVGCFLYCPKCGGSTWQDYVEFEVPNQGVIRAPKQDEMVVDLGTIRGKRA